MFEHRGVVEGFYGEPWTHQDRLWLLERMGRWGMNRYLYAPKDDPFHRARWREPHPAEVERELGELVARGRSAGVDVGFAISPGLSIEYGSGEDRAALCAKLERYAALGARVLVLAVDDVPSELASPADRERYACLADAHVDLAHALREALDPGLALWLVPTDYLGVGSTPYLDTLGRDLAPEIEVMWTGRTVLSPTLEPDEAASRASALRRRVLVWDNYPVTDGPMRNMLHLGPYTGRTAALVAHTSGFLLNPMQHVRASALALCTAAEFLRDPSGYDPEAAWRRALRELGGDACEPLERFAQAHRFSALATHDRDLELEAAMVRFSDALAAGEDLVAHLDRMRGLIDARLTASQQLRAGLADPRLLAELEPWLAAHASETQRMDEALVALGVLLGEGSASDKVAAFARMEGRLTRLCPPLATSYGPRRVLYPQLVDMTARGMRFGSDPTLLRGRNLADEWLELVEDLALWILVEPG